MLYQLSYLAEHFFLVGVKLPCKARHRNILDFAYFAYFAYFAFVAWFKSQVA